MSLPTEKRTTGIDGLEAPAGSEERCGEGSGQGCGEDTVTRDWDVWSVISEVEQFRVMTGTGVWSWGWVAGLSRSQVPRVLEAEVLVPKSSLVRVEPL